MSTSTDRPELLDLVGAALDHGIRSVQDGGPMIPFVIHHGPDGATLHRFVAETFEEGQDHARAFAWRAGPATIRIALAYDGYLTLDGERRDAIFVQAQAAGTPTSDLFAQQYEYRSGAVVEVGNAKHVDVNLAPLLAPSLDRAHEAPPAGTATAAPAKAPKRSPLARFRRR